MTTEKDAAAETMRASVLTAPRRLELQERPVPAVGEDEVLIRVEAVGVCGSDVHYRRDGRIGNRVVREPLVLGHEFAGEVVGVGASVTGWKPGDRVAAAREVTEGLGPEVVSECAGSLETPQQAIDMCRPRGRFVWVGIPPGDTVPLSIHEARRKELTILMARRFLAAYPEDVELAAGGRVRVADLVTHRFGLAETDAAFALVDAYADGVIKALIEPQR